MAVTRKAKRPRSDANLHVTGLSVSQLFGKITYDEIQLKDAGAPHAGLSVIYGDNGSGKTTLLHMLYCALSNEDKASLRSRLFGIPFRTFVIDFSGKRTITISKTLDDPASMRYRSEGFVENVDLQLKADEKMAIKEQPATRKLHKFLDSLSLEMLFVDHERYIRSTFSFLRGLFADDESEHSWLITASRLQYNGQSYGKRSQQFPLKEMVAALNDSLRDQAYRRSEAGDQDASAVYLEISRALIQRNKRIPGVSIDQEGVADTLVRLEHETSSYVKRGLLSTYPFKELRETIARASNSKRPEVETALQPFIASTERRLSALRDLHSFILEFEKELTRFLSRKVASYHVLTGLRIEDGGTQIDLDDLSSGEKQLLFLLCAAMVSRGRRALILIDEPELSLNYKWQRMIGDSLSRLSSGGGAQFIMASHSIEIISKFRDSATELQYDTSQTDS